MAIDLDEIKKLAGIPIREASAHKDLLAKQASWEKVVGKFGTTISAHLKPRPKRQSWRTRDLSNNQYGIIGTITLASGNRARAGLGFNGTTFQANYQDETGQEGTIKAKAKSASEADQLKTAEDLGKRVAQKLSA